MNKETTAHKVIDLIAVFMMAAYIVCYWFDSRISDVLIPYGTLYMFLVLTVLFFNHINLVKQLKSGDKELYLLIGGVALAGINMIVVRSNVGAIFTIADFLLILYLADKVCLPKGGFRIIAGACLALVVLWLFRWPSAGKSYGYNPNGLACMLFSLVCCLFSIVPVLFPIWSNKKKNLDILFGAVWGVIFILSVYLKARCVLVGIGFTVVLYFFRRRKIGYLWGIAAFSLLFPIVYIIMWKMGINFVVPIINKQFMSGRESIWLGFWEAFLQHPITGIGSDLERMVPNIAYYEAHNALMDLLVVHGIIVFALVVFMLFCQFGRVLKLNSPKLQMALYMSLFGGILAIGTFENYYITAPYNILFAVMFFAVFHAKTT